MLEEMQSIARQALVDMGCDPDEEIAKVAAQRPWYVEPSDFQSDGMWVCGTCGKPKQSEDGSPVVHRHQLIGLNRHKETPQERAERIKRNRRTCFAGEFREEGESCLLSRAAADTDPESFDTVSRWISSFGDNRRTKSGRGLILFGEVGRGKTFLAASACNALLDDGYRCLMTSVRRIRSQIDSKFGSQNDIIEWLCRFDLVVLDDLFRERSTDTSLEMMFTVVDGLYKMRVPTVVTTNMRRESLFSPNDAVRPVVDRLKERCERVEVRGPNRRQRKAVA